MKIIPLSIIFMVLIACSLILPASAQATPITVTTNRPSYSDGDQMVISGTVGMQLNVPISIVIRDPSGNVVLIGQVTANQDNTYSTTVTTGGDLWTATGNYEVDVTYGSKDNTAKTTFQFVGSLLTAPITIQGQIFNATYKITNGKLLGVVPTTSTDSLTIRIQPSGIGVLSITLPRALIDAKQNGQDSHYLVQVDGIATAFNETRTDTVSRTLTIPFESNSNAITVIGTQIVPEFSSISLMVLTLSMVAVIFYMGYKSRIRI